VRKGRLKKVDFFAHFIFIPKRHKNTLFTLILNNNIPVQKSLIFCALKSSNGLAKSLIFFNNHRNILFTIITKQYIITVTALVWEDSICL
jgi:hypothetical protein